MTSRNQLLSIIALLVHLSVFILDETLVPSTTTTEDKQLIIFGSQHFVGMHLTLLLDGQEIPVKTYFVNSSTKMDKFRLELLRNRGIHSAESNCVLKTHRASLVFILNKDSVSCFKEMLTSSIHGNKILFFYEEELTNLILSIQDDDASYQFIQIPPLFGPWSDLDNSILQLFIGQERPDAKQNICFISDFLLQVLDHIYDKNYEKINYCSTTTALTESRLEGFIQKISSGEFTLGEGHSDGLSITFKWWKHFIKMQTSIDETTSRNEKKVNQSIDIEKQVTPVDLPHPLVNMKSHPKHQGKRNLLMTCYITERDDPQREKLKTNRDDDVYIVRYYNTLRFLDLENTDVVIFHDGLSKDFQKRYSVIKFENFEWDEYAAKHYLSVNDQRYLLYLRYIMNNSDKFDYVLMTDLHDVSFGKDPFFYMKQHPEFQIFSGSEQRKREWVGWLQMRIRTCYKSGNRIKQFWKEDETQPLNAGIFGGKTDIVIEALEMIKSEFESLPITKVENCNYGVYNYVLYMLYKKGNNVKAGEPWHSRFKEKDSIKDGQYYVYHK